jgi:hypothetical protein
MRGIGGVIEPNEPIPGSIGWAYQRVTALRGMERENSGTPLTAHESKWRDWPRAWKHPAIFADCDPKTIEAEQLLAMRARVAGAIGATDAFKLIKTWGEPSGKNGRHGALQEGWGPFPAVLESRTACEARNVARGRGGPVGEAGDPNQISRARLRHSDRLGHAALAGRCAELTPAKMKADGLGSVFHVGRAKTGRAAFGTLSARTERLIRWYLGGLGFEIHVEAPLLRTRGDLRRQRGRYHQGGDRGSGRPGMPRPYTQNKLGQDFRKVRAAVFPGDNRTLADLRRSGTVEAFAGGAKPEMVSTKMADTLAASNHLFKTYNPAQVEMVRHVDDARRAGRAKLRRE